MGTRRDEPASPAAVALVSDLIFASKIRGAGAAAGVATATASTPDDVLEHCRRGDPRVILLDLETRAGDVPALIRRLKAEPETAGVPVIGFVSHVNRAAIDAAREAGANRVLARSAFVRELPALLRGGGAEDG